MKVKSNEVLEVFALERENFRGEDKDVWKPKVSKDGIGYCYSYQVSHNKSNSITACIYKDESKSRVSLGGDRYPLKGFAVRISLHHAFRYFENKEDLLQEFTEVK